MIVTPKVSGPFLIRRFGVRIIGACPCGADALHKIHEDYDIVGGSMIEEYTYCASCGAEWHAHDESVYPLPKITQPAEQGGTT